MGQPLAGQREALGSSWGEGPYRRHGAWRQLTAPTSSSKSVCSPEGGALTQGQQLSPPLARGERVRLRLAAVQRLIYKTSSLILPNTGITSKTNSLIWAFIIALRVLISVMDNAGRSVIFFC